MSPLPPLEPLSIPPRDPNAPRPTEAEIDAEMARIDGINGSGGHHLEDPYLRDLLRQQIAGDLTGDEAVKLGMAWITAKSEREHRLADLAARMWPGGLPADQP